MSAFWIELSWERISLQHRQGHAVGWTRYGQLMFWIGLFGFWVWSGIKGGRRNREERIQREIERDSEKNR